MSKPPSDGRRSLAILGYHKIGAPPASGWDTWFYVPERTFVGHLEYLQRSRWQVIGPERLLEGIAAPQRLPERAVLLTFDDGYRSNLRVALPWLRRFDYPAVMFVPTDFVGGFNSFDRDIEPDEPICDWDELRELARQGVSVQSHGASHRRLSELDPAEQESELLRSKAALEAGLGRAVQMFSYPYGDWGTDPEALAERMRRAGYRAACVYGGGPAPLPVAEPYRLPRLAIGPDTDLAAALEAA